MIWRRCDGEKREMEKQEKEKEKESFVTAFFMDRLAQRSKNSCN